MIPARLHNLGHHVLLADVRFGNVLDLNPCLRARLLRAQANVLA